MQSFKRTSRRTLFVIPLALVLFIFVLSVHATSANRTYQQNNSPDDITQAEVSVPLSTPIPGVIPPEMNRQRAEEAIYHALEKQLDAWNVEASQAQLIKVEVQDSWAYGQLSLPSESGFQSETLYILAHRQENGRWQATFPNQNNLYITWLQSIPDSLISQTSKETIISSLSVENNISNVQSLRLVPTPTPSTATYLQTNSTSDEISVVDFLDDVYGYELSLPSNWEINPAEHDKPGSLIQIINDSQTYTKLELGVFTYSKPDDISLSAWVDPDLDVAEDLVNQEETLIANRTALRHDYEGSSGSGAIFMIPTELGAVHFVSVMPLEALSYESVEDILASISISPPSSILENLIERDALYGDTEAFVSEELQQLEAAAALTGYRLPFVGWHTISTGPGCYSTHQAESYEAIDFGQMPVGTPIYSTQSGNITSAVYGYNGGFGNLLKIQHLDGNVSWYAHLDSFVKTSGSVTREELVAYSGNNGDSSGPHLHFEVRNSSNYSIWIRDLPGITWYSGDPNNPCQPFGSNDGEALGPALGDSGTCGAPSLSSPSDGQVINNRTVRMDWSAPSCSGLTGYTLHVTTGSGPEDGIILDTGVGPSEYTWTFPNDGTYYWHVAAWANGQRGPWSSRRIVIDTSNPSTGNWHADYYDGDDRWADTNHGESYRCDEDLSDTSTLDENWGTGAPCGMGGDEWVADYSGTIDFPQGSYVFYMDHDDGAKLWIADYGESVNGDSGSNSKFCNGTTGYNLNGPTSLRAMLREDFGDARIRLWWNTDVTKCLPASPEAPPLSSPTNGSLLTEGEDITLSWGNGSNAEEYYAEFWGGPADTLNSGWQGGTSWHLGSQWAGYTYSWHVKSRNAAGESGWSDTWSFTVRPGTPTNLTGSATSCNDIEISWQDNSGNEEGYNIYRNGVYVGQVGADTVSYQDTGLTTDTSYSYYVRAYRGSIESASSNTIQVTTQLCQLDPDLQPYVPAGYPYPVVPSSVAGTNEVNTLYAYETTYFDWHFINSGDGNATNEFHVELWVDDIRILRYPYSDYRSGRVRGFDDWAQPILEPGWHTVKLITDPDNAIAESDETNNVWERDFYWNAVTGWWGEYYNNETLSGNPVLVRDDPEINFNWNSGSPSPEVNDDHFSARWTNSILFEDDTYLFEVSRDDGARLWVNDIQILDEWEYGVATHVVSHTLSAGFHDVQMEMYEINGGSQAGLSWKKTCGEPAGKTALNRDGLIPPFN